MEIDKMTVPQLKEALKNQQTEIDKLEDIHIRMEKNLQEITDLKIANLSHDIQSKEISEMPSESELQRELVARMKIADDIQTRINQISIIDKASSTFNDFSSSIEKFAKTKDLLANLLRQINQEIVEIAQTGKAYNELLLKNKSGVELPFSELNLKKKIGEIQTLATDFKLNFNGAILTQLRQNLPEKRSKMTFFSIFIIVTH